MKIKTGVVGLGHISRAHVENLAEFDDVELVAFCDIHEKRLKVSAEQYGVKNTYTQLDSMLDNHPFDCVFILTPEWLHHKQSIACLKRGIHVLCEKPPSHYVEEAKEMAEEAKKADKILMIGFNRCFWLRKVKEFFNEKPPQICVAEFIRPVAAYRSFIRGSIHLVAPLIWICGEPKDVKACATYTELEKDEQIVASIQFSSGALGTLVSGYGTGASAELFHAYGHGIAATAEGGKVRVRSAGKEDIFEPGNSMRIEDRHFINCVKGEATPIITAEDGVKTMELAHRILEDAGIPISPGTHTGKGWIRWCPYCGVEIVPHAEKCQSCGAELGGWSIPIEDMV